MSKNSVVVTTTADVVDESDDKISFREAIAYAMENVGCVITFASLDVLGGNTITLNSVLDVTGGTFSIDGTLTSSGEVQAGNIIVSGNGANQILTVADTATLSVQDMTFTKGSANDGGAISNAGTLTILNSTFTDNVATGNGGAVANAGTMTVASSTFYGNSAGDQAAETNVSGQAIYSTGDSVNLLNNVIVGNGANKDDASVGIAKASGTINGYGINYADSGSIDAITPVNPTGGTEQDVAVLKPAVSSGESGVYSFDNKGSIVLDVSGTPLLRGARILLLLRAMAPGCGTGTEKSGTTTTRPACRPSTFPRRTGLTARRRPSRFQIHSA